MTRRGCNIALAARRSFRQQSGHRHYCLRAVFAGVPGLSMPHSHVRTEGPKTRDIVSVRQKSEVVMAFARLKSYTHAAVLARHCEIAFDRALHNPNFFRFDVWVAAHRALTARGDNSVNPRSLASDR